MSQSKTLTGTVEIIPEEREYDWGENLTNFFLDVIALLNHTFQTVTASGASTTVNMTNGHNITLALNASTTVTCTNLKQGERYIFAVVQGGAFTLAWADTIKWRSGTAPTITTGASAVDIVTLVDHPTLGLVGSYDQDFR